MYITANGIHHTAADAASWHATKWHRYVSTYNPAFTHLATIIIHNLQIQQDVNAYSTGYNGPVVQQVQTEWLSLTD